MASSTSFNQIPGSAPLAGTPACSKSWISLRRSWAAMLRVQAACTTGARSVGTTNTVRRIPSIRTRQRSSYSARSRSVTGARPVLAAVER